MATTKAYDIDFDNAGNVYIYGSSSTWQLEKYTSAGVLLWTYNATPISTGYFGDFACIRTSGKCICTEGFNSAGMEAVEVNTSGAQIAANRTSANMQEGWKIVWNPCVSKIIVGGGGWYTPQTNAGGWIDTNDVITQKNVLNQPSTARGHDIALTCYDPNGQDVYMATTQSVLDPTNYNNEIIQLPVATLTPPVYYAPTGFAFAESNVAFYISGGTSNGFNGMAASYNWLYIYNGATLKRCVKGTGAVNSTVAVTGTVQQWGGLAVDACDNLYVGENSAIEEYNSSLVLVNTYTVSSTIYGLILGNNYTNLYACGNGFVCSCPLTPPGCTHPALCSIVLPVQLQYFNCQPQTNGIELQWSTATETNNNYFSIERSINGINFTTIGTVKGAGNSSVAKYYSYTDEQPVSGENYYRLTQTDYDGNSQTFESIVCNSEYNGMQIYPNPTKGIVTIALPSTLISVSTPIAVIVTNVLGEQVYSTSFSGQSQFNIDLSHFTSGVYFVNVTTPSSNYIGKIMAER